MGLHTLIIMCRVDQENKRKVQKKSLSSYKGKVVIVTGSSGGIGSSIARKYVDLGCKVVLVARRIQILEELKSDIIKTSKNTKLNPDDILLLKIDLTKENECNVIHKFGKIDICVWNAGVGSLIEFGQVKDDFSIFRDNMDINYYSLVYSTSYALPYLKKTKGSIVVVSSLAGKFGTALRTSYSASKHAVQGFFNSLRGEVEDDGVQITVVCPGFVQTEFHKNLATLDNKEVPRESSHFMSPEDCADRIIKAEREGIKEQLLTLKSQFGNYFQPIIPSFITYMSNKTAKSSLKKNK
eukprot:gene9292-11388_t